MAACLRLPGRAALSLLLAAVLGISLAAPGRATAAVLTVTDFGDSGAGGQLRALVANAASGDLIEIGEGTIVLQQGPIDIVLKDLDIQGAGADRTAISGNDTSQVITVDGSALGLARLTLRNGKNSSSCCGGALLGLMGAALHLVDVVVRDSAAENGGGISLDSISSMVMEGGALIANQATVDGGGLNVVGLDIASLTNVTISGNRAGSNGGGLHSNSAATVTLRNATITDNTADSDGVGGGSGGGIFQGGGITVRARSSIIAGNHAPFGFGADCSGTLTSEGRNLVQSTFGCVITGSLNNITGVEAGLAGLDTNGAATPTHALLPGSLARDAFEAACPPTDQRGVRRPQNGRCDLGAFEDAPASALPGFVAGDFDGDGRPDLVVAAGRGGEPRVRVLSGTTGAELRSFLAYDAGFRGGVRVAVCDVTGDGVPDVVTAPGAGPPLIRVFDGVTSAPLAGARGGFTAFAPSARGVGASVGCADVSGDGVPDLLVGHGDGDGGQVLSFSGVDAAPLGTAAAIPGFRGGEVSVAP